MDKRSQRNKRKKSSKSHERANQGIFDKVASKVKGFLNPWLSIWNSVHEEDSSSSSENEEAVQQPEHVPQITLQSGKRPRLMLSDHSLPGCSSNSLHIEPTITARETDFNPSLSSRGLKRLRLHEHSVPACSTDVFSQASQEQDYTIQNSLEGKRQRLNLPDQNSNILSAGTQTWLSAPERHNVFSQASAHGSSSGMQSPLVENKESSVILNGDDHSDHSEGSASTSGCSSLVSHKDRINCMSSIMLGDSDMKSRRDTASQKGKMPGDLSSNRMSLWSSGGSMSVRSVRSPTVMQTNQPGFSLSAFIGSSKPSEKKVASPFYQGNTTYGGASASRRMPPAATPYQVDKPLRIKHRSNEPKDSYEGMSSAAKRILQTLEKMSSPVTDAKKIPNSNKSPVDLSLYLMPPKHRRNLQSTPAGPSKGPPIADISTISKLTTIKSYGQKRFQNSILDSPTLLSEKTSSIINVLPQILQSTPEVPSLPSGGGKMRNKLHSQHQPAAKNRISANVDELSRISDYIDTIPEPLDLPEIALPITTLPTIAFDNSASKKNACDSKPPGNDFVFSTPIEYVVPSSELSNSTAPPVISSLSSPFSTQSDVNKNHSRSTFKFSNPIEIENPISSVQSCSLNKESGSAKSSSNTTLGSVKLPVSSSQSGFDFSGLSKVPQVSSTWECEMCMVRNPNDKQKCLACETQRPNKNNISGDKSNKESEPTSSSSTSTFGSTKLPVSSSQSGFNFSGLSNVPQVKSTWECDACLVRNAMDKERCVACETLRPNKSNLSGFSFKGTSEAKPTSSSSFNSIPSTGFVFNSTVASSTTSATATTLSATVAPVSDGFVFSNKSDPTTTTSATNAPVSTSAFIFGSGKFSSPKTSSAGTENKLSATGSVPFKFGSETIPTSTPASSLGTSNNVFTFGAKPDTTDSPKSTTSSTAKAAPTLSNVVPQTIFGNSPITSGDSKPSAPAVSKTNPLLFGFSASSKETSWECSKCHNKNNADKEKCSACNADKSTKSNTALSAGLTKECSNCRAKIADDKEKCSSCEKVKPDKRKSSGVDEGVLLKGSGDAKPRDSITAFLLGSATSASQSPFMFGAAASSSATTTAAAAPVVTNTAVSAPSATPASSATTTAASAGFSFGSAITTASPSGPFTFGAKSEPATATTTASLFKFGSSSVTTSQPSTTNSENKLPSSTAATPFQFGKPSVATTTTAPASSFGTTSSPFTFGVKAEPANAIKPVVSSPAFGTPTSQMPAPAAFGTSPSPSVFGGAVSNAMSPFGKQQTSGGLNLAATAVSKTNPLFQFGAPSSVESWECSSCHMKNNSDKTACASCGTQRQEKSVAGFTFKGATDAKPTASALNFASVPTTSAPTSGFTFNAPSTTTAASTGFTFNATPASSATFMFAAKSATTTTTTSAFTFGSSTSSTAKPSITGFESKLSSTPVVPFQFGSNQPAAAAVGTSMPSIGFGSTAASSTFAFGAKSAETNSLQPSATSTQMPAPAFGSAPTQPMFGNSTASPAFGKQAPGGFNFGLPTPSNSTTPVFQFNAEKKQATQSGFSFGTPSQDNTMTQNFAPQFNMSTPPTFNFGVSSAAGPFQFAANSDSSQSMSAGQRKIRKAVRRMK